jgi:L,D-transpeptidase ErfK/SrfK
MRFLLAFFMIFSLPVHAAAVPAEPGSGEHLKGAITTKPHAAQKMEAEEIASDDNEDETVSITIPEPAVKPEPDIVVESDVTAKDNDEGIEETEEVAEALSHIGQKETIYAKFEDTLLELGRAHNLGYVEMVAANPGVDPWLPGEGTKITLPKKHLLPDAPREGIVINLAEMRMYNFVEDANNPTTHPLGIGREGLHTPLGITTVTRKKEGPSWRPTARMRKEDPELPEVVPPGEDNPLGTHALYLGWPAYLIHGTHKPLGVGRRVSSGCIRMYPEDIVKIYEAVPVGTKVNVIKQPIKLGWIDDMLYLEAHAEDELADTFEDIGKIKEYRVPETLFQDLERAAGDQKSRLDWQKIRQAVKTRSGMPVAILQSDENDEDITEDVLKKEPVEEPQKPRQPMRFNS